MKSSYRIFIFLVISSPWAFSQGGIIGGLGDPDGKPERGDNPVVNPATGPRPPVLGTTPGAKSPTGPKPGKQRSHLDIMLEGRKRFLEEEIKKAEEGGKPEEFDRASDAQRSIDWMEKQLKEMERQLDVADTKSAGEMRNEDEAFQKKWADVAKAIEEGKKPDGMSGEKWAKTVDEYQKAKATLEAKRAHRAWQLKNKRKAQLADLKEKIEKVKETLKKLKESGKDGDPAIRRLRKKLLEKRAQEAQLALMKRQLAEYEQLKKEISGNESSRNDSLMADVYNATPYWFVNELAKVNREIALVSSTKPPTKKQQGLDTGSEQAGGSKPDGSKPKDPADEEGLPLPEWMKKKPDKPGFDEKDWKKAKLKALTGELEDAHRRRKVIDSTVIAEDEAELSHLRSSLEANDSAYGDEVYKKHAAEREAKIAKRRKELEASRAKRTQERRKAIDDHINFVKERIARESK